MIDNQTTYSQMNHSKWVKSNVNQNNEKRATTIQRPPLKAKHLSFQQPQTLQNWEPNLNYSHRTPDKNGTHLLWCSVVPKDISNLSTTIFHKFYLLNVLWSSKFWFNKKFWPLSWINIPKVFHNVLRNHIFIPNSFIYIPNPLVKHCSLSTQSVMQVKLTRCCRNNICTKLRKYLGWLPAIKVLSKLVNIPQSQARS